MVCLIGLVGLAVDFGHVAARKTMLQNYVDAKAVAALKEQFGSPARTISAEDYLGALGTGTSAVIGPGAWDFATIGGGWVDPAPVSVPATMVPARSARVDALDVPLFFGPLFGIHSATIDADAIAFAPKRHVVIVQDVSGSMCQPCCGPCTVGGGIGPAKTANQTLVNWMVANPLPGDQVGIVEFNNAVVRTLGLTPLATSAGVVNSQITTMTAQGCTNIGAGITAGTALFTGPDVPQVERIMIVVGDGADPAGVAAATTTAANNARLQGIAVYTIYFSSAPTPADRAYLAALAQPPGYARPAGAAPVTPAMLTGLLIDIVTGVPMRLVQ
jgi:hypothetical protein